MIKYFSSKYFEGCLPGGFLKTKTDHSVPTLADYHCRKHGSLPFKHKDQIFIKRNCMKCFFRKIFENLQLRTTFKISSAEAGATLVTVRLCRSSQRQEKVAHEEWLNSGELFMDQAFTKRFVLDSLELRNFTCSERAQRRQMSMGVYAPAGGIPYYI